MLNAGTRLFDSMAYGMHLYEVVKAHPHELFSQQVDPGRVNKVVSLEEVERACGPFYRATGDHFGERPLGWGRAAGEDRIFSWRGDGFGLVGDQLSDVEERYISAAPMTRYRDVFIAGPWNLEVGDLPWEFKRPHWTRFGIDPANLDIRDYWQLFYSVRSAWRDLNWTQEHGKYSELREAMSLVIEQLRSEHEAEIMMSQLMLQYIDVDKKQKIFKKAIDSNPAIVEEAHYTWIAVQCMATAKHQDDEEIETAEYWSNLNDHVEKLKPRKAILKALVTAMRLIIRQYQGQLVTLEELELLPRHFKKKTNPCAALVLWRICEKVAGNILAKETEADNLVNQPDLLLKAIKSGARPDGMTLASAATDEPECHLLRFLLKAGFSPHGRLGMMGYINPLASAVIARNEKAVKLLLKHGADPSVPTHHFGSTALELAEANLGAEYIARLFKKHLKNPPHTGEPPASEVAHVLAYVAQQHMSRDEKEPAMDLFQRALRILGGSPDPRQAELAWLYNNIGTHLISTGEHELALKTLLKALSIKQEHHGPKHTSCGITLYNIGEVYREMGKLGKALEYFKESLDIERQHLGPTHPEIAETCDRIGDICWEEDEFSEALTFFQQALSIREENADHPDLARTYYKVGLVYVITDEPDVAVEYLKKAIDHHQQWDDPSHPFTQELKEVLNDIGIKKAPTPKVPEKRRQEEEGND